MFYRHFLFGKIKVRLRFGVRNNVITMTHRGRHEQVTGSGVSLKYQTNPDQVSWSTTRCILIKESPGLSHAMDPPPDHGRIHRCWSPEDSTGHGCVCGGGGRKGSLREEISRKQSRLLHFVSHLNRSSCFDSGPDTDVTRESCLGSLAFLTSDRRRICSWAGRLTWAFYSGRPVQI